MAEYSIKEISVRIRNIENTKRVTKAMELIASSKSRKAKSRLELVRPFIKNLKEISGQVFNGINNAGSPYIKEGEEKNPCYIVIGGDRGFAGGYNSSIIKKAESNSMGKNVSVIPIGIKMKDYFSKSNFEVITQDFSVVQNISFNDCSRVADILIKDYLNNEIDSIYILYTEFISSLKQIPKFIKILPFNRNTTKQKEFVLYEPNIDDVVNETIPYYLSGIIWGAVCESLTSEYTARHMAMESASKNASDIVDDLSLIYNQLRQSAITQEIIEVVSGV